MTKTISRTRRAWQTLVGWVSAMDYSPHEYALDRVDAMERELLALKSEVSSLRIERAARVTATQH